MGLGQHFTRAHVTLAMFIDKYVADTCRFGNFHFGFFFFFVNEKELIKKSRNSHLVAHWW